MKSCRAVAFFLGGLVLALLAGLALAGESTTARVGTLLWVLALAGWALSLSSVRRGLVRLRQGLAEWAHSE